MHTAIALTDLSRLDPDTRARIEQAVLEIFSTREFHRIGLIEIARGANVSLQTIYKYYGSKEKLLFSGLDSWLAQLTDQLMPHLQGEGDLQTRLRETFVLTLAFFEHNPKIMQIVMSSVYFNTWRRTAGDHNRELLSALARLIAQGRGQGLLTTEVSETALVDFYVGVVLRVVQGYISRNMQESLAPQAGPLFDMLWRAIARP